MKIGYLDNTGINFMTQKKLFRNEEIKTAFEKINELNSLKAFEYSNPSQMIMM